MSERYRCAACLGKGELVDRKCPHCQGKGFTGNAIDYLTEIERLDRELNRLFERSHAIKQDWDRF